jgi:hypothetical protein
MYGSTSKMSELDIFLIDLANTVSSFLFNLFNIVFIVIMLLEAGKVNVYDYI